MLMDIYFALRLLIYLFIYEINPVYLTLYVPLKKTRYLGAIFSNTSKPKKSRHFRTILFQLISYMKMLIISLIFFLYVHLKSH